MGCDNGGSNGVVDSITLQGCVPLAPANPASLPSDITTLVGLTELVLSSNYITVSNPYD